MDDIEVIDGKSYRKVPAGVKGDCSGCVFYNSSTCFHIWHQCRDSDIIYKKVENSIKHNLWIDVSWLKGKVREVITKAIIEEAKKYSYRFDVCSSLNLKYIELLTDGSIQTWITIDSFNKDPDLHEISVNDALNGNFDIDKLNEDHKIKIGDVICYNGIYHIVEDATNFNTVLVKGTWIKAGNYKLCHQRKSFKFYTGQKVINMDNYEYYTFLRYDDNDIALLFNGRVTVLDLVSSLVPASLKERYEVIK